MKIVNLVTFFFNIIKYKFSYFEIKYCANISHNKETELSGTISNKKRVFIYGFGPYGAEFFLKFFDKYIITGICDINYEKMDDYICNPNEIFHIKFDYIIITVMDNINRNNVIDFLKKNGVSENKILYLNYK